MIMINWQIKNTVLKFFNNYFICFCDFPACGNDISRTADSVSIRVLLKGTIACACFYRKIIIIVLYVDMKFRLQINEFNLFSYSISFVS